MVGIDSKSYENNGAETVAVKDEKLWLNEKHMEEWLDHKNLPIITNKFSSSYRKHEQVNEPRKNST